VWRALLALVVLVSARLAGASELIAVPDRVDHVFDPTRGILYISTSSGRIQRFDTDLHRLLRPLRVGTSLRGLDITADGLWIYATEAAVAPGRGVLHKVSTSTGAITNIRYLRYSHEGGSWDIAIGANGLGLMTSDYVGSGYVYLRALALANDDIMQRRDINPPTRQITERTQLSRNVDGSTIFLQESDHSNGPIHTYDAWSDSFVANDASRMYLDESLAAVSGDGSMIAMEMKSWIAAFDPFFNLIEVLNVASGGLLFDPAGDRLFVADIDADEIVGYDTTTWDELDRWAVDEDISTSSSFYGTGVMSATDDGMTVFLSTESGIRMISVPPSGESRAGPRTGQ
jgi:hypothetical protein